MPNLPTWQLLSASPITWPRVGLTLGGFMPKGLSRWAIGA